MNVFMYQLYNVIPTGLPVGFFALFDKQYPKKEFLEPTNSKYYKDSVSGIFFNKLIFWRSMIFGVIQSLFMFFILYTTTANALDDEGHTIHLFIFGNSLYVYVCILVNLELLTHSNIHNPITIAFIFIGIISSLLMFLFISIAHNNAIYNTFTILFTNPTFLSILAISTIANILLSILINRIRAVGVLLFNKVKRTALPENIQVNKRRSTFILESMHLI
jgi:magnesium-transporting ATPase (P-type)